MLKRYGDRSGRATKCKYYYKKKSDGIFMSVSYNHAKGEHVKRGRGVKGANV